MDKHPMLTGQAMVNIIELAVRTRSEDILKALRMTDEVAWSLGNRRTPFVSYGNELWTRRGMVIIPIDYRPKALSKEALLEYGEELLAKGEDLTQKERAHIRWVLYLDD